MARLLENAQRRLLPQIILFATIFLLLALSAPAIAEEFEAPNRLGFFLGATADGHERGGSIGLEYEYEFPNHWGVGVLGEYAGGDFDLWLVGVPIFYHLNEDPFKGLSFWLAPCLEREDSETRFVGRLGLSYDFEIAHHWFLAPEFNLDFNRRERDYTQVFGLTLSYEY